MGGDKASSAPIDQDVEQGPNRIGDPVKDFFLLARIGCLLPPLDKIPGNRFVKERLFGTESHRTMCRDG